jgi:hypothetical protein
MKLFVFVNAIIEILAGLILFFVPTIVPDYANASGDTLTFINMYGAAAMVMGLIALLIWKNYESIVMQDLFVKAFSLFHAGVAIANLKGFSRGLEHDLGPAILHGILALITLYFLFSKKR